MASPSIDTGIKLQTKRVSSRTGNNYNDCAWNTGLAEPDSHWSQAQALPFKIASSPPPGSDILTILMLISLSILTV